MKRRSVIFTVIMCMLVAGCAKKEEKEEPVHSEVDEDFYRVTMGYGFAQKCGDMLYTQDFMNVYESIIGEEKVESVKVLKDTILEYLNVLDDKIYYRDYDDNYVEKNIESGETRIVFDKAPITDPYVCANGYTYALCGRDGPLVKIKTADGSYEEICKNVMIYAKYGDDLYYIWDKGIDEKGEGGIPELWKLSEKTGEKAKIELEQQPISLYVYRDKVYYVTMGDFELHIYDLKTGKTEKSDAPAMYIYFVNENYIYYTDVEQEKTNGKTILKRYNMLDKTDETIFDGAHFYNFTVFSDGSIVVFCDTDDGYSNYLLTEKNGKWVTTDIK